MGKRDGREMGVEQEEEGVEGGREQGGAGGRGGRGGGGGQEVWRGEERNRLGSREGRRERKGESSFTFAYIAKSYSH